MAPGITYAGKSIHAVLLDLDGTLYDQRRLRAWMALELARLPLITGSLRRTHELLRAIRCFRKTREELRELGQAGEPLETLQYEAAARRLGMSSEELEGIVAEWIYRRPLRFLGRCRRAGLPELFTRLEQRKVRAGVFSDYPSEEKLEALGLRRRVSLCLSATDPRINAFKPHPKGFLTACDAWCLEPSAVLYVGDRADVDAAGADAAGMPCALIGSRSRGGRSPSYPSFARLMDAFDDGH